MMMRLRSILCCGLLLLGAGLPLSAQFYTHGADPGGLRWNQIETPTYRVVYPRGQDSLARAYALALERVAGPVSGTLGIRPNAAYTRRMPVVLHLHTSYANGLVTWTPRRMELLTVPDADPHDATPWMQQLALHESRHVAQMQAGALKPFRWLNVLTGQLGTGGLAAIYGGPAFFEGDAVTAETALSISGRGRTADFLEYYRVSFAAGDFRDYWRWRYGSQRWYTPDYYRAGYLAVAGIRSTFDVPDLSARFYRRIAEHSGVAFLNWDKTVREATGLRFKDAFAAVCDTLQHFWSADETARGPFQPEQTITPVPRRFTSYTGLEAVGDDLYAIQSGLTQNQRLVRIAPHGRMAPVKLLGVVTSSPLYSMPGNGLFWSEEVRDARWPLRSWSVIRRYDGSSVRTLTRRTRFYYPAPAPDQPLLSVTEYPVDGTSRVVLLDAQSGERQREWTAPAGMQVVETAWLGDELYASAVTDEGFGLYRVADFAPVLAPRPVQIHTLRTHDGRLLFTCDLTGVKELYALDPADGRTERLTTTRFGADDFLIARDTLFYTSLQPEGRLIRKTAVADLQPQEADFSQLPRFPFAEELSAGEPQQIDWDAPVEVGDPQPYNKLAHLFRFHSWLPFYVDYDGIEGLSLDAITRDAGLGATAFWQNDLGTSYGFAGYHAAPVGGIWRHSLHANFTYTGLYPVIEARVDFGDRNAMDYFLVRDDEKKTISLMHSDRNAPSVTGSLRAYIPWNFTSGGWQRGLVPTATHYWNNDRFSDGSLMHRTTLSLRGYVMQRTPHAAVYPRFGLGVELGWSFRWVPSLIAPSAYAYLYGYLPGLHATHGIRWNALLSRRFDGMFSEAYALVAPRGFPTAVSTALATYQTQFKASADYKLPLIPVDRALLGPVAYLRNFELTLHGDWSTFSADRRSGSLFSVGADFAAVLGNFLWVPYPTRIGVSYNYNGGRSYADFAAQDLPLQRHVFSLIFSVEM